MAEADSDPDDLTSDSSEGSTDVCWMNVCRTATLGKTGLVLTSQLILILQML